MRPTQAVFNAAKKSGISIPVELTPLFISMGVALMSGTYFTYKHLTEDKELRVIKNADLSIAHKVIEKSD